MLVVRNVCSKAKAMEMCLTGRMMDVAAAERAGLVSCVEPTGRLMEEARGAVATIASVSLPVVIMDKELINRAFKTLLSEGL